MAYEFIKSPNYTPNVSVFSVWGVTRTFKAIVIHWWDYPAKKPSIAGVISHFQNPTAQVSAHYVVNDTRTVQMVSEGDGAWHAKQANPFSIGIECDPNGGEAMYRRLGELVKDIRNRRGALPLKKHSEYVQTSCPGTIDLHKIDSYASNNAGGNVAETVAQVEQRLLHGPGGVDEWKNKHYQVTLELRGVQAQLESAKSQVTSQQEVVDDLSKENRELIDANAELQRQVTELRVAKTDTPLPQSPPVDESDNQSSTNDNKGFRLPTLDSATFKGLVTFLQVNVPVVAVYLADPQLVQAVHNYAPWLLPALTFGAGACAFLMGVLRKDVRNY